jgi:hypothetical protein
MYLTVLNFRYGGYVNSHGLSSPQEKVPTFAISKHRDAKDIHPHP